MKSKHGTRAEELQSSGGDRFPRQKEWKPRSGLMNGGPCTTQLTVPAPPLHWAPIEETACGGRGGGGWSLCHVFFISADGFKCLLEEEMGGWKEQSGVPGRAAEREGTEGAGGRGSEGGEEKEGACSQTVQEMQCLHWREGEG